MVPKKPRFIFLALAALVGCAPEATVYFPNHPVREVDCAGLSLSYTPTPTQCEAGMAEYQIDDGAVHIYRETAEASGNRTMFIARDAATGQAYITRLPIFDVTDRWGIDNAAYMEGRERSYNDYSYVRLTMREPQSVSRGCFAFVRYMGNRHGHAAESIFGFYCDNTRETLPTDSIENVLDRIVVKDFRGA